MEMPLSTLMKYYYKPGRYYHNIQHIFACQLDYNWIKDLCIRPDAVQIALWFHDAIYDSKITNNEELSAYEARIWLSRTSAADFTEEIHPGFDIVKFGKEVERLIMLTKHGARPYGTPTEDDTDGKYMVDLDLSIFGQDEPIFDEYEENVRKEYGWVETADFKAGRKRVLEGFMAGPIYMSYFFKDKYEDKARANLERSIKKLS